MRTFKILGAVLCVLGCIFALLGILTSVLPLIENEQFKLIVNSFQEPSSDSLTNTLNALVLFCLRSGYFLLFCGISLTVTGGLISSAANKRQKTDDPAEIPITMTEVSPNADAPKPAYYPGGLAPPTVNLITEPSEDDLPIANIANRKGTDTIIEDVLPEFVTEESDAYKLMRNDQHLANTAQYKRPAAPELTQYISNTTAEKSVNRLAETAQGKPKNKPKIVSTMGKNKPLNP